MSCEKPPVNNTGGYLLCFFQHLAEEPEESERCDRGGGNVADRLCQEHSKGLVLEEVGQEENQGNQQN